MFNSATTPSTSSPVPVFSKILPIFISIWLPFLIVFFLLKCLKSVFVGQLKLFSISQVFQSLSTFMFTPTLWRAAQAQLRQTTGELTLWTFLLCLTLNIGSFHRLFVMNQWPQDPKVCCLHSIFFAGDSVWIMCNNRAPPPLDNNCYNFFLFFSTVLCFF